MADLLEDEVLAVGFGSKSQPKAEESIPPAW